MKGHMRNADRLSQPLSVGAITVHLAVKLLSLKGKPKLSNPGLVVIGATPKSASTSKALLLRLYSPFHSLD